MTDIVERLRGRHDIHYAEAADEIETLRQQRDELAVVLRNFLAADSHDAMQFVYSAAQEALAKMEEKRNDTRRSPEASHVAIED